LNKAGGGGTRDEGETFSKKQSEHVFKNQNLRQIERNMRMKDAELNTSMLSVISPSVSSASFYFLSLINLSL